MEPYHNFGTTPSGITFVCLTILRHQKIKMSIYKVDKKHWVIYIFCFLVPVRKILKNTVALDHHVLQGVLQGVLVVRNSSLQSLKFSAMNICGYPFQTEFNVVVI